MYSQTVHHVGKVTEQEQTGRQGVVFGYNLQLFCFHEQPGVCVLVDVGVR